MMKNFFLRILLLMGLLIAGGGLQAQDYTSSLTNPSFETGNYKGWTVTYPSGTTLTWCGTNSDADAATKTGTYIFGIWNYNIPEFEISQAVSGLPNGVYKVSVDMQMSATSAGVSRLGGQRVFAGTSQTYYREVEEEDFLGYDNTPLHAISVLSSVTNGTLKLGVRTDPYRSDGTTGVNGVGWFKIDNFRLQLISKEENVIQVLRKELQAQLDSAANLGNKMQLSVKQDLDSITLEASAALADANATESRLNTQIANMTKILSIATESATAYQQLNKAIAKATEELTGYVGYYYEKDLKAMLADAIAQYGTCEVNATGITTLCNNLTTLSATCAKVGKVVAMLSDEIVNPSFETGYFDGWTLTYPTDAKPYWCAVESSGDAATRTGNSVFGIWNSVIPKFQISQTLVGLVPGTYRVFVDMMVSAKPSGASRLAGQRVFAGDKETYFRDVYAEDNLGYDDTPFHTLTVDATVEKGGQLTLGVRTDPYTATYTGAPGQTAADGCGWFKIDNFRLALLSKNEEQQVPTSTTYEKQADGLLIQRDSVTMKIQFYSDAIVRVVKYPERIGLNKESLSVTKTPNSPALSFQETPDSIIVFSDKIRVTYRLTTGQILFSDATGHTLLREKAEAYCFAPKKDAANASYQVKQAFLLDDQEAIYGLGQIQNGDLSQRGKTIYLRQENMKVCIPYVQSGKKYGLFWDNYSPTTFTDNTGGMSFTSTGLNIDYYFLYSSTGDGVVTQMRDLTGQSPMLPLWNFGYYQSKERYQSDDEVVEVVQKYRDLKVPLDCIVQDWQYWGADANWNSMSFDNPTYAGYKDMIQKVHDLNAKLLISVWANFGPSTAQYAEFTAKGMLIPIVSYPTSTKVTPYDPYNPEARDIFWRYLNQGLFSKGIDGWWLDSSEPDHSNPSESDYDNSVYLGTWRSVRNAFPLEHIRGIYEHQRVTSLEKRVNILTRSAFAGQQRYAANTWSGDVTSSWENLRKQIPAALNFSMCGIPYWNSDIGGFFSSGYAGGNTNTAFRELYVRWLQFATFCPMMRSHGTDTPREIYRFGTSGTTYYDAIERFINIRYRMLPYLYSTAWEVTNHSASFMRAAALEFGDDAQTKDLHDEYLFGSSFLVAPKLEALSSSTSRSVYLPKGAEWYDFWTGDRYAGGQTVEKATLINSMPLYVKAGTILPWGPKVQYSGEKKWDDLELRIYEGANASFTLYEDEGDNYNYENGAYTEIPMTWNETTRTLTLGARKGSFNGMLQSRRFKLVLVDAALKKALGDVESSVLDTTVTYTGSELNIHLGVSTPIEQVKEQGTQIEVSCSDGILTISSSVEAPVAIYNTMGQQLLSTRVDPYSMASFSLKSYASDIYIVRVGSQRIKITRK